MAQLIGTGAGPHNELPAVCGAASLVGKEGYIVISDGTASTVTLIIGTATSEASVGILTQGAAVGGAVIYASSGRVLAKAGGTVSAGVPQMWATGAKCIDATGDVKTVGIALQDAVDGDLFLLDVQSGSIGTG